MQQSSKVTFIATGLLTGGAETVLLALLSRLDRARFVPEVVSLRGDGPMRERIEALGVPVRLMNMRPGVPHPGGMVRLFRHIRRARPDLVQGWMYHGNLAASMCAKLAWRAPVLWSIHNSLYDWSLEKRATALIIRSGALLSRSASRIVYCAEITARQHEAIGFRADRTVIVPNGFDVGRFQPDADARGALIAELGAASDALLAGHIARFHPHKDHRTLSEALRAAMRSEPRLHAVLAGSGIDARNEQIGAMMDGLPRERVHLLGPRSDIPRLMAGLDFLVSSSVSEAFPMVVGEAMACGLPCVVTDVGDSAKLLDDLGIVVPPSDSGALAEAMIKLAAMPGEERRELGRKARDRAVRHFSLDEMVRRYEGVFQEALATQRVGVCAA
jgi:glycosyltransferase involved in cell wall biosynthesis